MNKSMQLNGLPAKQANQGQKLNWGSAVQLRVIDCSISFNANSVER